MNVKINKRPAPKVVPMYNMKHGEIGIIVDIMYRHDVVKAYVLGTKINVFSLNDTHRHWDNNAHGSGGGLRVELLEPGTELSIAVTATE